MGDRSGGARPRRRSCRPPSFGLQVSGVLPAGFGSPTPPEERERFAASIWATTQAWRAYQKSGDEITLLRALSSPRPPSSMGRTREVVFQNLALDMTARSLLTARARVEAIRLYARHYPKWGGQPLPATFPADVVARIQTSGGKRELMFRVYQDTFDLHPSRRGLVPANGEFILTSWSAAKMANEDIGAYSPNSASGSFR